jgi:tetratricopeptide (TPR) repeat protein
MRGSTNRGGYPCSRAGAGVCPGSFVLSSALLTSGSPSAATHLAMLSRSGAGAGGAHEEPEDSGDPLDMEIRHGRERLAACPSGHEHRAYACASLALSLLKTSSTTVLDEVITLCREAVALLPAEHPLQAGLYNNLANALQTRYEMAGSSDLLDEAITLLREALALRPAGHPDRAISCNNLASALQARYNETGSSDLLDEAITLLREALSLCPAGPPLRAGSCNNLANALWTRYEMTGNSDLLDEAITLYREALALCPAGHPDRSRSCNNLANALWTRYEVTGGSDLLDESITLFREALALCPAGHPLRAISCNNLANALQTRYEMAGSSDLLDEAITLYREALALQPAGHPARSSLCNNLADQLLQYFRKTQDLTAIDEALALARESAASASPSFLWYSLTTLCDIYTEQESPHLSISTATEYLSQASALHPDSITQFMRTMQHCLALIWSMQSTWTADTPLLLLGTYSNLIDMLSRMTGFVIDLSSQLTALKSAHSFGSDACIAALLSNNPRQAMELVDRAHGVVWAQALRQRDPQLEQLPEGLAAELGTLLRAVSVPVVASGLETSEQRVPGFLSPQDIRHGQNSRIQTLLTEIRAMPGLDRFMLGHTYAQLRETASKHPAIVLVAARGQAYALIMPDSKVDSPYPLPLAITLDSLSLLRDFASRAGLRNGQSPDHMDEDARLGLAKPIKKDASMAVLSELWLHVVKPILDYLQVEVRTAQSICRTATADMSPTACGRSLATAIVLVSHRRLCLSSIARSGHLSRATVQASVLC